MQEACHHLPYSITSTRSTAGKKIADLCRQGARWLHARVFPSGLDSKCLFESRRRATSYAGVESRVLVRGYKFDSVFDVILSNPA